MKATLWGIICPWGIGIYTSPGMPDCGAFLPLLLTQEGGEGRGEEARFVEIPLSPALSPLVPRGERGNLCRYQCFCLGAVGAANQAEGWGLLGPKAGPGPNGLFASLKAEKLVFGCLTGGGNADTLGSMPRAMRVEHPGAIYHVMDRGDQREDI